MGMVVSAWHGGSGSYYGIRLSRHDRDRHFSKDWESVCVQIADKPEIACFLTPSFWNACIEIRGLAFRDWFEELGHVKNGQKAWSKGKPPKFLLTPVSSNLFQLKELR